MQRVIAAWRDDRFTVLSSPAVRAELAAVVTRPAIRQLAAAPLEELVQSLERYSLHVPGDVHPSGVCRDPKDEKFLACALEGHADYLVSSDRDLLDLEQYREVAIVNPGQFLLALELFETADENLVRRFGPGVLKEILRTVPLDPDTAARVSAALTLRDGSPRDLTQS